MPTTTRPQTLKQARRAYQRNRGPAQPSASEVAQAERRAALQERAYRIKEREARRKANLKRREEKVARERETARQGGKPSPIAQKPGWKVCASQLSLGGFFNRVKKLEQETEGKTLFSEEVGKQLEQKVSQEQIGPKDPTTYLSPQPQLLACVSFDDSPSGLPAKNQSVSSALQMPPPARPKSKQPELQDIDLEDCFPSNTQIQRELSLEPCRPYLRPSTSALKISTKPTVNDMPTCDTTDVNELLTSLSTQDLDFSNTPRTLIIQPDELDLLAQISTQDLASEPSSSTAAIEADFVDQELLLAQISTQDVMFSQDTIDLLTDTKSTIPGGCSDAELERFISEFEIDEIERSLVNVDAAH